jgi:hypothetical protein
MVPGGAPFGGCPRAAKSRWAVDQGQVTGKMRPKVTLLDRPEPGFIERLSHVVRIALRRFRFRTDWPSEMCN